MNSAIAADTDYKIIYIPQNSPVAFIDNGRTIREQMNNTKACTHNANNDEYYRNKDTKYSEWKTTQNKTYKANKESRSIIFEKYRKRKIHFYPKESTISRKKDLYKQLKKIKLKAPKNPKSIKQNQASPNKKMPDEIKTNLYKSKVKLN